MTRHENTEEVTAEQAVASDGAESTPSPPEDAAPAPDGDHEAAAPSEEEAGAAVEADLDALRQKAAERDEYLAIAQRTQADFENYRKRMTREVSLAEGRGVSRLARELLPALDGLDRAIAAAPEG